MVDGYNRNKEFGQEVNEWLKQRRNKREEQPLNLSLLTWIEKEQKINQSR